jgi:hypothetical protein
MTGTAPTNSPKGEDFDDNEVMFIVEGLAVNGPVGADFNDNGKDNEVMFIVEGLAVNGTVGADFNENGKDNGNEVMFIVGAGFARPPINDNGNDNEDEPQISQIFTD